MLENFPIITGSGKGGGGGHTPVEYPDGPGSRQKVKLLFAINDGEIDSNTDILLNGASYSNFDVDVETRPGTQDQTIIPGFSDVESPLTPFTPQTLTQSAPYVSADLASDVSAVRLTFLVQTLLRITDQGDRTGYSVSHSIYVRKNAGTWIFVATTTESSKHTSPYAWDVRVTIGKYFVMSPTDTWSVRIERDTQDDSVLGDKYTSPTSIQAITRIYENVNYGDKLRYPGVALVALTLNNPAEFGNNIPEIMFRTKLTKLYLPTNYNPLTRFYDESTPWNGTFKTYTEWTNNLGWVIYNVLTRHPSGFVLPTADVDVGSFYLFAKYCDQLVDDGKGSTEPRFRCDIHFTERMGQWKFMSYLLALGNATLGSNEFGQIEVVWDRAGQSPSHIVTNANVVDGLFVYTSNDVETRSTQVNVTYNDERQQGRTNTASDDGSDVTLAGGGTLIDRYGLQTQDIILSGCLRESQAIRKARWAVWVNCMDTEIITFRTMFAADFYRIGQIISIMDSDNAAADYKHAKIVSATTNAWQTVLALDRTLNLELADVEPQSGAFTISFYDADAKTIVEKTVLETSGSYAALTVTGTVTPFPGSDMIIQGRIIPRTCKIVGKKLEENIWTVTAVQHSEQKYEYIENGYAVVDQTGSYVDVQSFQTEPVSNITLEENHVSTPTYSNTKLEVSWAWDEDLSESYRAIYRAVWNRDNQEFKSIDDLFGKGFDIDNPLPGVYEVIVWAVNPFTGIKSPPVTKNYNYRVSAGTSTLLPPTNVRVAGTAGLIFDTPDCKIAFDYPAANNDKTDALFNYKIEILDFITLDVMGTYYAEPDDSKNGVFVFTFAENVNIFSGNPARQFRARIYSRDLIGDLSNYVEAVFNNPVPAATSMSVTSGLGAAYLSIQSANEADFRGYIVYRGDTPGFTPASGNIVYDGPDTAPVIPGNGGATYYYRVAVYDSFGKTGLNVSSEYLSTLLTTDLDRFAFTGLDFTPNSPGPDQVSWGAAAVTVNGQGPYAIPQGNATWESGTLYLYFDKSTKTIGSTNSILVAVTKAQILAAYEGGTSLKGGDGSAFFNGSQLLAQSVGAGQLVTNTAIITEVAQLAAAIVKDIHIENGAITNAKIKDIIESSIYSAARKEGWRLDKEGIIETYGKIKIGTPNVGIGTPTPVFEQGPLTLSGNALLNNSIVKKQGVTSAWDEYGYSLESYGTHCVVEFSFAQTTGHAIAGLSTNPTLSPGFSDMEFAIYAAAGNGLQVFESNSLIGVFFTSYSIDDIYSIEFSGGNLITYYKNGVSFRTVNVTPSPEFHFKTSIFSQNAVVDQVKFGQKVVVTPDYGARMEITGDKLQVYDRFNTLRVKIGNLS